LNLYKINFCSSQKYSFEKLGLALMGASALLAPLARRKDIADSRRKLGSSTTQIVK